MERHLDQHQLDLLADGVRYRQAPLYLDDDEFRPLVTELDAVIQTAMAQRPRPGRRQRTFSNIIVPAPVDGTRSRPIPGDRGGFA